MTEDTAGSNPTKMKVSPSQFMLLVVLETALILAFVFLPSPLQWIALVLFAITPLLFISNAYRTRK